MTANWAIEVVGLEKSYGATRVLRGLDLRVPRGSVFALLGPNGAGKTTTIRILATLTTADAGHASVAGFDVVTQRRQVRRRISVTGQAASVDEVQTGAENLVMMGRLGGLSRRASRDRADELLTEFDLVEAAPRRVSTYSGGMRRRLDLAAGLVIAPDVVFLDEPTTGLDVRSRQAMWRVVSALARDGVTVLLTTQYLEEADQLADDVAVIDDGRVVAQGSPAELKRAVVAARLVMSVADDGALHRIADRARALGRTCATTQSTAEVETDGDARQLRWLLDELDPTRGDIVSFDVHAATLDDVFLSLTGRPGEQAREGALQDSTKVALDA